MNPEIQFLRTLAALTYDVSLSTALRILDAAEAMNSQITAPDLNTHEGLTAFARTRSDVMTNLPDRRIQAIKNLRTAASAITGTTIGLKEAKDAIDAISPY